MIEQLPAPVVVPHEPEPLLLLQLAFEVFPPSVQFPPVTFPVGEVVVEQVPLFVPVEIVIVLPPGQGMSELALVELGAGKT